MKLKIALLGLFQTGWVAAVAVAGVATLTNIKTNTGTLASTSTSLATNVSTPVPLASGAPSLSDAEKRKLQSQFRFAKSEVELALKHQEKSLFKELNAAQSSQSKQWRIKEKKLRRDFFDAHMSGPERRQYVQDYLNRKRQFDQSQKDEYAVKRKEWGDKVSSVRKKIAEQEVQFKKSLDQSKAPAADLWPKAP